jgi:hypothetical protein
MKQNTLFEHKEFAVTFEKTMANVGVPKIIRTIENQRKHQITIGSKRCAVSITNQVILKSIVIGTHKIQITN